MEVAEGWLQPTLARIANDRSVVVVPLIDGVSSKDMSYINVDGSTISGLRWHLIFYWFVIANNLLQIHGKSLYLKNKCIFFLCERIKIPQRELLRTQHDPTAPIRIPTHVGCAFSIDREFFFEIGSYDEQMDIWGSENVELAFRVSIQLLIFNFIHIHRVKMYLLRYGCAVDQWRFCLAHTSDTCIEYQRIHSTAIKI